MTLTQEQTKIFWSKVDRTGECWLWQPRWTRWRVGPGLTLAPRECAWVIGGKDQPAAGQYLCVTCGDERCVRHIVISTHRRGGRPGRVRDKGIMPAGTRAKLRDALHVSGEDHGRGKLTTAQARVILNSNDSLAVLAKRFNVSRESIRKIRRRITWAQLR